MPKQYKTKGRQFIINLLDYFKRERLNRGPLIPVTAVNERVANAFQISMNTVNSVKKISKAGGSMKPKKRGPMQRVNYNLDESKLTEIRNTIFDMVKNKEQITLKSLKKKFHEKSLFEGSEGPIKCLLKRIGFKYTMDGIMELPDIAILRTNFLVSYMRERFTETRRQFIYMDEMVWIIENGTGKCLWHGSRHKIVQPLKNEAKRYVVFHAGNEHGFLPDAALVISSKNKNSSTYRPKVNDQNFLKWFEEILQKLDKPTAIVMHDATYRSYVVKNEPNLNWSKADIKNWLQERLIFYHNNLLKTQLLEIVKRNLPPNIYEVQDLATKYGHEIIRVPPFHGVFNPMELIWGIVEDYYNENVELSGGYEKALAVFEEALGIADPTAWQNSIKSTETVIQNWWQREAYFDQADIVPATIYIRQESDSEDSSDLDSQSDSESVYEIQQNEAESAQSKSSNKAKSVSKESPVSTTTDLS